jgi:hypothetical protein
VVGLWGRRAASERKLELIPRTVDALRELQQKRRSLRVETRDGVLDVRAGQAVIAPRGEWVRYSTPAEGARYVAVCVPAFSPDSVHRD